PCRQSVSRLSSSVISWSRSMRVIVIPVRPLTRYEGSCPVPILAQTLENHSPTAATALVNTFGHAWEWRWISSHVVSAISSFRHAGSAVSGWYAEVDYPMWTIEAPL